MALTVEIGSIRDKFQEAEVHQCHETDEGVQTVLHVAWPAMVCNLRYFSTDKQ